jgi:hypothetical protein
MLIVDFQHIFCAVEQIADYCSLVDKRRRDFIHSIRADSK